MKRESCEYINKYNALWVINIVNMNVVINQQLTLFEKYHKYYKHLKKMCDMDYLCIRIIHCHC